MSRLSNAPYNSIYGFYETQEATRVKDIDRYLANHPVSNIDPMLNDILVSLKKVAENPAISVSMAKESLDKAKDALYLMGEYDAYVLANNYSKSIQYTWGGRTPGGMQSDMENIFENIVIEAGEDPDRIVECPLGHANEILAKGICDIEGLASCGSNINMFSKEAINAVLSLNVKTFSELDLKGISDNLNAILVKSNEGMSRKELQNELTNFVDDTCNKLGLIKSEALEIVNKLVEISEMNDFESIKSESAKLIDRVESLVMPGREDNINEVSNMVKSVAIVADMTSKIDGNISNAQSVARVASKNAVRSFKIDLTPSMDR